MGGSACWRTDSAVMFEATRRTTSSCCVGLPFQREGFWGPGCGVWGLGYGVWGLFKVSCLVSKVSCLGFRVWVLKLCVLG